MKKKKIAIITGENTYLGSGHMQRMKNLHWYLNEQKDVSASLLDCGEAGHSKSKLLSKADLVIRDMRDSDAGEIALLREYCPVLVIDDWGEGRGTADYVLDLLPHPEQEQLPDLSLFLYGYNFTQSIKELDDRGGVKKTIDLVIYPGHKMDAFYEELVQKLAEKQYTVAVLQGDASFVKKDGKTLSLRDVSSAEIILSAKVVLSHFGILLYEGHLAGCKLFAINPTEYHSQLADIAQPVLGLENLGVKQAITGFAVVKDISILIDSYQFSEVAPSVICKEITQNLSRFSDYILDLL